MESSGLREREGRTKREKIGWPCVCMCARNAKQSMKWTV